MKPLTIVGLSLTAIAAYGWYTDSKRYTGAADIRTATEIEKNWLYIGLAGVSILAFSKFS